MGFTEVAKVDELTPGKMKGVTITNHGGKCTHAGGNLSKGELDGNIVTCPRHGSKFDVTTGKNVGGPAQKYEPAY